MQRKKLSRSSINTSNRPRYKFGRKLISLKPYFRVLPILILIILLAYLVSKIFIVQKIKCITNDRTCSREVEGIVYHLQGKNYFSINKKELEWSIDQIYPADQVSYSFTYPNTLVIDVTGDQEAFDIDVYQPSSLPTLSLDAYEESTVSGYWNKPIPEIKSFISELKPETKKLWESGELTPEGSASGRIRYIFSHLPSKEDISKVFALLTLADKYLDSPDVYIVEDRIFLSQAGLPDIIVNTDADIQNVELSLQSLDYLVTIKKDARVINISFKHPIIK